MKRRSLFAFLAAVVVAACGGAAKTSAPAPVTTTSAKGPLADLSWLSGHWVGVGKDGEAIEESWSSATDNVMTGMGRSMKAGSTLFHEYMVLEVRPEGLVYQASVLGKNPVVFRLESTAPGEWTFTNPTHDHPTLIRYRRQPDGSLLAHIEGPGGKDAADFAMTRAR